MEEKTKTPVPLVRLEYESEEDYLEIYVLDEGDAMAWNSSTNYDHHMHGPSLVFKRVNRGHQITEHYVNDPDQWHYIDKMMRLGKKYIDENPDFDAYKFGMELREVRKNYKPHRSMHQKKD